MIHVNPYKTADELGITNKEHEALVHVYNDMSRSDYIEKFSMMGWTHCVCGKMRSYLATQNYAFESYSQNLSPLFLCTYPTWPSSVTMAIATREDAIAAMQNFLLGVEVSE